MSIASTFKSTLASKSKRVFVPLVAAIACVGAGAVVSEAKAQPQAWGCVRTDTAVLSQEWICNYRDTFYDANGTYWWYEGYVTVKTIYGVGTVRTGGRAIARYARNGAWAYYCGLTLESPSNTWICTSV